MGDDLKSLGLSRFAKVFFIACFLLVAYFLYLAFRPFFSILAWAGVLAAVFHPLFRLILSVVRGRRGLAAFVTCLLILLLIVLPITLLGILLSQQSIALYHGIESNIVSMQGQTAAKLQEFQNRPWIHWVLSQASRWLGAEALGLQGIAQQVLSAVSRFVVSRGPSLLAGVGGLLGPLIVAIFLSFLNFYRHQFSDSLQGKTSGK
ncbi:MAG: AI-2E family transporter [bacterium]